MGQQRRENIELSTGLLSLEGFICEWCGVVCVSIHLLSLWELSSSVVSCHWPYVLSLSPFALLFI